VSVADVTWRVYAYWTAIQMHAEREECRQHDTWAAARQDALQLSCLAGIRYLIVARPDAVVAGEYDRYTNRWRQYPRTLVEVDHTTEVTIDTRARFAWVWCTCGASRATSYARPADEPAAVARAAGLAAAHVDDPARTLYLAEEGRKQ
jgi:hypothetical protein